MPRDVMTRPYSIVLALAAALALWPSAVGAQTAISANAKVKVKGETRTPENNILYVRVKDCQDPNTPFEFTLTGYSGTTIPVLEAWASTSANCNTAASRATVNNTQSPCWSLGKYEGGPVSGEVTMTFSASQLFSASGRGGGEECDKVAGSKYTVYFVPLPTETSASQASPPEPVPNAQQLSATFTVYTQPPSAPTNVSGLPGETQVGIKWEAPANITQNSSFRVYYDPGQGGGTDADGGTAACGSGLLVSGGPVPEDESKSVKANGNSGTIGGLDGLGVSIGDSVAMAVATVDVASNRSVLSNVVCVQRVNTAGFWDACNADPNCKGDLDKCSAEPGRNAAFGLSAFGLMIAGAVLFARRRRNV